MAKHVVAVFGYGCHLTAELMDYLNRVVRFCNEYEPDYLIFSGGFTQAHTAFGRSEAKMMARYVYFLLHPKPQILLDERAYTTPDNAFYLADLLREKRLLEEDTELTVFCEATRTLKVDDGIRYFVGRRADIETASWELMSPTKQIISTLVNWVAIRLPPLRTFFHNQRLKRAELI